MCVQGVAECLWKLFPIKQACIMIGVIKISISKASHKTREIREN